MMHVHKNLKFELGHLCLTVLIILCKDVVSAASTT